MDLYDNNEHYYYITLVSDGGAHTPCISAWSYEALNRSSSDEEEKEMLKWSYADSPYCCWKQEKFDGVEELLCGRKTLETKTGRMFTIYLLMRLSRTKKRNT